MITQLSDSLNTTLLQAYEVRTTEQPDALLATRQAAFERFKQVGFPTVKNEDWKYLPLQGVLKRAYRMVDQGDVPQANDSIEKASIEGLEAYVLTFVDGVLQPSSLSLPAGVTILPIEQAFGLESFQAHFAVYADQTDNPFVALNTALFRSGYCIHVSKNVSVDRPIHVIWTTSTGIPSLSINRNLVVLESGAKAELIESWVGASASQDNLQQMVTEVVVKSQANLQHYLIQTSEASSHYITHTEVYQERDSHYNHYNCQFPGASLVRNDINVRLDGTQVESHLYGVVLTNQHQLIDNHTIVDHLKPHCESYEWYKTITQEASTVVFNGKIFVREDAQKTNAFQQNNNVLIGDQSTVNSKPQLEIFADDVKCSHGCTMGQFDDEALFYLRARAIGEQEAKALLVKAFAFDVTSRFENEVVRAHVERCIEAGLVKH
jgi:Fe-S cluster assembly protein SufD